MKFITLPLYDIDRDVDEAFDKLEDSTPVLGILFTTINDSMVSTVKRVYEIMEDVPLIGATSGGVQFVNGRILRDTPLFVLLGSDDDIAVDVSLISNIDNDVESLMPPIFARYEEKSKKYVKKGYINGCAMILADAFSVNGDVLVDEMQKGDIVPFIFGGLAGDNWRFEHSYVFYNGGVYDRSMVVTFLYTSEKIGIGTRHGWKPLSNNQYKITKSEGNILYEINGRPAIDVWLDELVSNGISITGDILSLLAKYELGIESFFNKERYIIRAPLAIKNKGIVLAGNVRNGDNVTIMKMTIDSFVEGAGESIRDAISEITGEMVGALVFSCAARYMNMGEDYEKEVNIFSSLLNIPYAGFNTYGEISRYGRDFAGFHNSSVVTVIFTQ